MSILAKARALAGRADITSVTASIAGGSSTNEKRKKSLRERISRGSIQWTPDLQRILDLPRRDKPSEAEMEVLVKEMTERLKKPEGTQTLWATQAWLLSEFPNRGGGIASVVVGGGKTLPGLLMAMVFPDCKHAVLLVPAQLKHQLLSRDWDNYSKHWKLPNLAGDPSGRWIAGRPTLRVLSYAEASSTKNTDLLKNERADLIVADEIDSLRNPGASRTIRFLQAFAAAPDTRLVGWSGSLTSDSVSDYSHLCAIALAEGSPLPLEPSEVKNWGAALDANSSFFVDPGELRRFCLPTEDVRSGFRRRLMSTPGFIATDESKITSKLFFYDRKAPELPEDMKKHLQVLRRAPSAGGWLRPDGEELTDAMAVNECARQLICGFHYYWHFFGNPSDEEINEWFERRQEYNREVRAKLLSATPYMESPKLCENAAERWFRGGCSVCERLPLEEHKPGCKNTKIQPLWDSQTYLAWNEVEDTIKHEQRTSWLSDYLLADVAEWAQTPGIVWVEHTAMGHKLAEYTGLPYYGQGEEASKRIIEEDGHRSIIASMDSHRVGKNLQNAFWRNLIITVVASNSQNEQLIGRTFRSEQPSDRVEVHMYLHSAELRDALEKAEGRAAYVYQTQGTSQALLSGTWEKQAE